MKTKEDQPIERWAVCEFGGRHKHVSGVGFEDCACGREYGGVAPIVFELTLRKMFPSVNYSSDITPVMKQKMRQYFKQN